MVTILTTNRKRESKKPSNRFDIFTMNKATLIVLCVVCLFVGFGVRVVESAYPVDAYIDFESGVDDGTMTSTDMNASSHGISGWVRSGDALHMYISNTG